MKLRLHTLLTAALAVSAFAQQPPVSPMAASATASPDDAMKSIALNAVMSADPERGIPLVEGILKGNSTPGMKDRAMSVLVQNKSPRAQQVLADYAKATGDPDMQLRAVRYMGRSGTKETQQQLAGLYASAGDARVKQEILRSLMASGDSDSLLAIAKSEKDATLRNDAIRDLGSSENTPTATLTGLYAGETDAAPKKLIISMLANRGDAKAIIELGRKETDPSLKTYIVQRLSGMSKNKDAMDFMMELLK